MTSIPKKVNTFQTNETCVIKKKNTVLTDCLKISVLSSNI